MFHNITDQINAALLSIRDFFQTYFFFTDLKPLNGSGKIHIR